MTVLDFDDFTAEQWQVDLIHQLRQAVPDVRLTLFTILGQISEQALQEWAELPWVEIAAHGWDHTRKECARWGVEESRDYIRKLAQWDFINGFKAPYWQGNSVLYKELKDVGYWVADNIRYSGRHQSLDKVYMYNCRCGSCRSCTYKRVHGHIPNVCGNGLEECMDRYSALQGPFMTISEVMEWQE